MEGGGVDVAILQQTTTTNNNNNKSESTPMPKPQHSEGAMSASARTLSSINSTSCINTKNLLSPCFGGGKPSNGRIAHHTNAASGRSSCYQEFAQKSHRLMQQHHIKRKLSTTRTHLMRKNKAKQAELERLRAVDLTTKCDQVDQEIKQLEEEILEKLSLNILQEISLVESVAHGAFNFLSTDLEKLKEEFMSEHTLRRFLIARNWDVDLAMQMLMEYYRWREINPVGEIQPSSIETSIEAKKVFMHKKRDLQGRPILIVVATRHMVESQPIEETIRFVQYCTDKIMHLAMDDENGVSKMCVFVDLKNVGGHCLDKTALGVMLELMQNYFPERLGTAILWRPPTIFWLAWKLIHNFIPKETRRRMCFAYKQKDVAKFMDPALVPEMLGGSASDNECLIPIQDA
jgi:hypothetical protein